MRCRTVPHGVVQERIYLDSSHRSFVVPVEVSKMSIATSQWPPVNGVFVQHESEVMAKVLGNAFLFEVVAVRIWTISWDK